MSTKDFDRLAEASLINGSTPVTVERLPKAIT